MAPFAGFKGSTPMRSTPMIFSYAPTVPNGRPSSTVDRCVIRSAVTAMWSLPSARGSSPRLDGSDDDVGRLPGEIVLDVLDGAQEAVANDFGRLPGIVRRQHHAGEREEGIVRLDGLVVEHVEAGACDPAPSERIEQGLALDQSTAPGVHENRR